MQLVGLVGELLGEVGGGTWCEEPNSGHRDLVRLKDIKAASNTHLTLGSYITGGAGEEGGWPLSGETWKASWSRWH